MMPIKFSVVQVDKKFIANTDKDRMVHVPGLYSGQLSNITEEVANGMIERKNNLVSLKNAKQLAKDEAHDETEKVKDKKK